MIEFDGQSYSDDRLFVLYLCKGTIEFEPDGTVTTIIYHNQSPDKYVWCVVTYRNCRRYPLYRVDSFYEKSDAMAYMRKIEPETPLISLGGKIPDHPLTYEIYLSWKNEKNYKDYEWQKLYTPDGSNAQEAIRQTKEQFRGIK